MPIWLEGDLRHVDQKEFARVAYDAMGQIFAVRNELGRLFQERIYKTEVAARHGDVKLEVPINVGFDSFQKKYFIDMLVSDCAIFEVKAAESIAPDHRAQLINYLMLLEVAHGKLVNVYPEIIQHEFVNARMEYKQRTRFKVDDGGWIAVTGEDIRWKEWITSALRDWGTGLDLALYTDALIHALGGREQAEREMPVVVNRRSCGTQKAIFTDPESIVRVSSFPEKLASWEHHLQQFARFAQVHAVHWLNIGRGVVTFHTFRRD